MSMITTQLYQEAIISLALHTRHTSVCIYLFILAISSSIGMTLALCCTGTVGCSIKVRCSKLFTAAKMSETTKPVFTFLPHMTGQCRVTQAISVVMTSPNELLKFLISHDQDQVFIYIISNRFKCFYWAPNHGQVTQNLSSEMIFIRHWARTGHESNSECYPIQINKHVYNSLPQCVQNVSIKASNRQHITVKGLGGHLFVRSAAIFILHSTYIGILNKMRFQNRYPQQNHQSLIS